MSQHSHKRREILHLIQAVRSKGADGVFDETVRQKKAEEAVAINARGLKRQVEYLIDVMGMEELHKLLTTLLQHHQDVIEVTAEAAHNGSTELVHRAVYSEKQKEAEDLSARGLADQVGYLIQRLGSTDRLRQRLRRRDRRPEVD